ncbi:MAG: dihydroorotate oxidase [Pseudomonadota bacterium]
MSNPGPIDFINHDYRTTFGDRCLNIYKKVVADPETRHDQLAFFARMSRWLPKPCNIRRERLRRLIKYRDGSLPIELSSPIMLAAGGNKFARNLQHFANFGFGAITVGTATRNAREGNPFRPRIRMLPEDRAIQNSMGLNNPGVDRLAEAIELNMDSVRRNDLCVGLSVAQDPDEKDPARKLEDMFYAFRKAYGAADYVEVNISCPNTGSERIDSELHHLEKMMSGIMKIRRNDLSRKAVYAKLSPDMSEPRLCAVLDIVKEHGINGVILFNTLPGELGGHLKFHRRERQNLKPVTADGGLGGISGRCLYANTFRGVAFVKRNYPDLSVIASGGIDHGRKVFDLLRLGADAVQCYSVLAYRWMAVWKMLGELEAAMKCR